MFKTDNAPPAVDGTHQRYLCIVTASWPSGEGDSKTGVFAQHVSTERLDALNIVSTVTVDIMRSSGLPISPVHVVVIKNDQVVANFMPERDYVSSDLWDLLERTISAAGSQKLLA